VADESADPKFLAADMIAQLEHDPNAKATLLATDETIAEKTIKEALNILSILRRLNSFNFMGKRGDDRSGQPAGDSRVCR